MKSSFYIHHPEVFQGEHKLQKKDYFEGWYFKNTSPSFSISFIPGIHIQQGKKKAFIQVITKHHSYYVTYAYEEFSYSTNPFFIRIGQNIFSKEYLHLDIEDLSQNLIIQGELFYTNPHFIQTTSLSPTIMGPFAFLPFMECNHGVLCMKNTIQGFLTYHNETYSFEEGIGYIEKDWGTSFPSSYIWCQANHFENVSASFFLSIATIPKPFPFTGFICSFLLEGKEYRFASYNKSKIIKKNWTDSSLDILLKQGVDTIRVTSKFEKGLMLKAPNKGNMTIDIFETIDANLEVSLYHKGQLVFCQSSPQAGLEIV